MQNDPNSELEMDNPDNSIKLKLLILKFFKYLSFLKSNLLPDVQLP